MDVMESGRGLSGRVFRVRKGAVPARAAAVLDLPLPGHAEEAGSAWRQAALDAILSSGVRPFVGPVEVSLMFRGGRQGRAIWDLPNACLQLLIGTRLIASADSRVLRRLTLCWGAVGGVRIEIHPAEGAAT